MYKRAKTFNLIKLNVILSSVYGHSTERIDRLEDESVYSKRQSNKAYLYGGLGVGALLTATVVLSGSKKKNTSKQNTPKSNNSNNNNIDQNTNKKESKEENVVDQKVDGGKEEAFIGIATYLQGYENRIKMNQAEHIILEQEVKQLKVDGTISINDLQRITYENDKIDDLNQQSTEYTLEFLQKYMEEINAKCSSQAAFLLKCIYKEYVFKQQYCASGADGDWANWNQSCGEQNQIIEGMKTNYEFPLQKDDPIYIDYEDLLSSRWLYLYLLDVNQEMFTTIFKLRDAKDTQESDQTIREYIETFKEKKMQSDVIQEYDTIYNEIDSVRELQLVQ